MVEAQDEHSAVSGFAYAHSTTGDEPIDPSELSFDSIVSFGGLVRWEQNTSIPDGPDGPRTIFTYARDRATNVSAAHRIDLVLDRTPPEVSSATVTLVGEAGGSPDTTQTRVTTVVVELDGFSDPASGLAEMRVWNGGHPEPEIWEAYQPGFAWSLIPGDGPKTVNVRVRDLAGNVSDAVFGSIILDQTPPTTPWVHVVAPDVSPPFGLPPPPVTHVRSHSVDLVLSAQGATEVLVANNSEAIVDPDNTGWRPYPNGNAAWMELPWNLDPIVDCELHPSGVTRTVYARFRDSLHNPSDIAQYEVVFDCSAPCAGGSSLLLDRGSPYTRTVAVTVEVSCIGEQPTTMIVDCDGTVATGPFQPSFACMLSGEQGTRSVEMTVVDAAGNELQLPPATIVFDDRAPDSPVLTPGNAVNVNYSCALIGVPSLDAWGDGTYDAGHSAFSHYEARSNGGPWKRIDEADLVTIGEETTIEFGLLQDTGNLLEVRAVDHAGNLGQPAIAWMGETSSTLLPTHLQVTHVCDNGRFAILKDTHHWPITHTWWNSSSPEAASLKQDFATPRIALLDLRNLAIRDLNGPDGLVAPIAAFSGPQLGNTIDAACAADDPRVAMVYVESVDGSNGAEMRTRVAVWDDPLTDTSASSLKYSEPWEETLDWGGNTIHRPLAINKIDAIHWDPSPSSIADFTALVVTVERDSPEDETISLADVLRVIRVDDIMLGAFEQRLVHPALLQSRSQYSETGFGRRIHGLALDGNFAAALAWNWDTERWEVRHAEDLDSGPYSTEILDDLVFEEGHGFTQALSPWNSHVRPASFDHLDTGVPSAQFIADSGEGDLRIYDVSDSSYTSLGSSGGDSFPSWVERGLGEVSWVHPNPNRIDTFVRHNDLASGKALASTHQRYAIPVDTTQPIHGTGGLDEDGLLRPGADEVIYHTRGMGHPTGIVIGLRDLENEVDWLDEENPFPSDHPAVRCFVDVDLRP